MSTVIAFDNVCFSYGSHEVLHNVTFTIEEKSFIGIVGPNGGGKTTLLRLILGLESPDKGSVMLLGDKPEKKRGEVGYVMQQMHYDERFPATVLDIVLIGRTTSRSLFFFSKNDKMRALQALTEVGMENFSKRSFAQLSGGQRQRVLIAQALCGDPKILLLDEPTANIDIEGEEAVNLLLNKLAHNLTVVSVSHNINTVLKTVSHVICVNKTIAMSSLDAMHPDVLARASGGDLAVLHHEISCRVYGKSYHDSCQQEHK
jgi:zinc transport system ATP-binding protein